MIFTKKGQVLDLGAGGEWDDVHVVGASVIYKDNLFYIFYSGYDGSNYRIGLATSPDGVTFTKKGQVYEPSIALSSAYAYLMQPFVIYKDNMFYMYHTTVPNGSLKIKCATSPDGVTFTDEGLVLDLGAGGEWDDVRVFNPSVIYKDNLFYMFYSGYDGSNYRTGLATSPDGVTFTKKGQVLNLGAGGTWDDSRVFTPSVLYKDNLFYMFYMGYNGSTYRIGLATSPDGVTFTKKGQVLNLGAGGEWDDEQVSNPSVIYKDNLFYMIYMGYDGSTYRIGLAVSGCEPLRIHEWRANAATGTCGNPEYINDGLTSNNAVFLAVDMYAEIDLGSEFCIKQFRHSGHSSMNGDGEWKIQYWSGSAWVDWITGIATRNTDDWSAWVEGRYIRSDKIRLVVTTKDTGGMYTDISEVDVKW